MPNPSANLILITLTLCGLAIIACLPARPVGRWLREFLVRVLACVACGVMGMAVGIILEFPRLIAGAFEPRSGELSWTPIGLVGGVLAGVVMQFQAARGKQAENE